MRTQKEAAAQTPQTAAQNRNQSLPAHSTAYGYTMGAAAATHAANGISVFPCQETGSRAKSPYTLHGFKDATRNQKVIEAWWQQWPNALIGIVPPPYVIVFDIDPRSGGSIEALENKLGKLPPTLTVLSGRGDGGCHLYYKAPAKRLQLVKARSNLVPGVDIKGMGRSYLIAPPSLHPDTGKPYVFENEQPIAELPPRALHKLIETPQQAPIKGGHYSRPPAHNKAVSASGKLKGWHTWIDNMLTIPKGSRNDYLNRKAYSMCVEAKNDPLLATHLEESLNALAANAIFAGLTSIEVVATINSAKSGGGH